MEWSMPPRRKVLRPFMVRCEPCRSRSRNPNLTSAVSRPPGPVKITLTEYRFGANSSHRRGSFGNRRDEVTRLEPGPGVTSWTVDTTGAPSGSWTTRSSRPDPGRSVMLCSATSTCTARRFPSGNTRSNPRWVGGLACSAIRPIAPFQIVWVNSV